MKDLLSKEIIHGRSLCSAVYNHYEKRLPEVKVSKDISIVTVVDKKGSSFLSNCNVKDNEINFITVENYIKWTTKVTEIIKYIEENYSSLPKYILYLDAFDAGIINDIEHPERILEYYNCKVLFNSEPDFWHTGASAPNDIKGYYDLLYYRVKDNYIKKNSIKFNLEHKFAKASLNAGVFLGEKDFVLKLFKEALKLMTSPGRRLFPYGCMDDQLVLRYLHDKYHYEVCIDIFQEMMMWGTHETLKFEKNSPFGLDYFRLEKKNYENKVKNDLDVIITTSMIPSHPSTEHIDGVMNSLKLINLPERCNIIIACDGTLADETYGPGYLRYLEILNKKYRDTDNVIIAAVPTNFEHGLTHNVKYAFNYVSSDYVLVLQHDLPFIREFDIKEVIKDMANIPQLKNIRFNKRKNILDGCEKWTKGRKLDLYGNVVKGGKYEYISTPCWSDNNHLTTSHHYREVVLEECTNNYAMETQIYNGSLKKVYDTDDIEGTKRAHNRYGTYIFDSIDSEAYITHTDGYPKR